MTKFKNEIVGKCQFCDGLVYSLGGEHSDCKAEYESDFENPFYF